MPRILIAGFCALPGPDRPGVQLRHVVRSLVRHHDVDVLVARRGDQAYVERFDTARLLRVPIPEGDFAAQVEAFRRALRRQLEGAEYDVVHVRDGWAAKPALELRSRLGFALVFDAARSPMSEPVFTDRATATELERTEEACARGADLILAPSEAARPYLGGLALPQRVHVAPPGVDVDAFDWDEPPPPGPPRLLYLGSLAPGRGVRVLLRAMVDIAPRSDAVLVLAGYAAPDFRRSLEQAVRDLGLGGRVELAGPVAYEDLPAQIASATVCVAPGAVELDPRGTALYPTKLLEYMACQRAVVAPRRGTVTMMLRDGQHGLLFEPGQPADLAVKVLTLVGDPPLRDRLARAGYELVRRVHTASGTRRQIRRGYAWLAAQDAWLERLSPRRPSHTEPDVPMPTSDFAGEIAAAPKGGRADRAVTAFDSDTVLLEDTGARHLDGDDVTKVEMNPIGAGGYLADEEDPASSTDEWVVDDEGARPRRRSSSPPPVAIETSFVAGELEVPASPPGSDEPETAETAVVVPDDEGTGTGELDPPAPEPGGRAASEPSPDEAPPDPEVDTALMPAQADAPGEAESADDAADVAPTVAEDRPPVAPKAAADRPPVAPPGVNPRAARPAEAPASDDDDPADRSGNPRDPST